MLNQVPMAITRMAKQIVHNHPNSIGIQAFRKRVTRAAPATMGGLGVLSSEDEEDFVFDHLGNGSALVVEGDMAPSMMNDNADVPHSDAVEYRFLVEPDAPSGDPEWFDPRKGDLILLWLMDDGSLKIPFEIVGVETVNNLPPFSVRFVCNRRDDLLGAMNGL